MSEVDKKLQLKRKRKNISMIALMLSGCLLVIGSLVAICIVYWDWGFISMLSNG